MRALLTAQILLVSLLMLAPPVAANQTRIAFGSCFKQDAFRGSLFHRDFFDEIVKTEPDAFLFLGDNVYADTLLGGTDFEAAYTELTNEPGYKRLQAATKVLATWDDHDYGVNDGDASYPRKEEAEAFFERTFPAIDPKRDQRPGVYDAWTTGTPGERIQVILLDTRFFRTADDMLGPDQWAWLAEQLQKPADVRLLVSSIQVLADQHRWERWTKMPDQHRRLFETIQDAKAKGLVILSGDRHMGALYRQDGLLDYPVYEATSSSLNATPWDAGGEPDSHRLHPQMVDMDNFGMVTVDWQARTLTLDIRGYESDVAKTGSKIVQSVTINLAELR